MKADMRDFDTLNTLCRDNGFIRRGKSFFRVHGDGVLQVLSLRKFASFPIYYISLGIFSMYSELLSQWFTDLGCIPNYSITVFLGHKHPMYFSNTNGVHTTKAISLADQISLLDSTVLPFLNNMITQTQLMEGIAHLDFLSYRVVLWNDIFKLAPCLHSGDYSSADTVVRAILNQHKCVIIQNDDSNPQDWCIIGSPETHSQDIHLLDILKWIHCKNEHAICNYLNTNFKNNVKSAKHIIPR